MIGKRGTVGFGGKVDLSDEEMSGEKRKVLKRKRRMKVVEEGL